MNAFLAAFQFLTIIPVPKNVVIRASDLKHSSIYFPMVGLMIGLLIGCFDTTALKIFSSSVVNTLIVALSWAIPGGLHIDGLADTADGFLSSKPKEKILEIMRDSRSGPMAVAVLICTFALKWTASSDISLDHRFSAWVLAPVLGRGNILLSMNFLSYARSQGGLASVFVTGPMRKRFRFSLILTYFLSACYGFWIWNERGILITITTLGFGALFSRYSFKKIGGFTGDTLGAICELTETWVLLAIAGIERMSIL